MAFPVAVGFLGYLDFGVETSYGVAVTVTKRLPLLSFDPAFDVGKIPQNTLQGRLNPRRYSLGGESYRFTTKHYVTTTQILRLIDCFMGSQAYNAVGGATVGPTGGYYTHTFIQELYHNSLTLELGYGGIPDGDVLRFTGAKIDKAVLEVSGGLSPDTAIATLTFDWVAYDAERGATPSATLSSSIANTAYTFRDITGLDDGYGGISSFRSYKLTVDNKLLKDRWNLTGAGLIDEPVRGAFSEVLVEYEREYIDNGPLEAYIANTNAGSSSNASLTFGAGSGASNWMIFAPSASAGHVLSWTNAMGDDGLLVEKYSARYLDDAASLGSNTALTITVSNNSSAIATN